MKYIIVMAKNSLQLEMAVNKRIADGWTPQGGAFLTGYSDERLGQAMLRDKETPTGEEQ